MKIDVISVWTAVVVFSAAFWFGVIQLLMVLR